MTKEYLMIKKIYHGSPQIIKAPKFSVGRPSSDFGLGFYCAEDPGLAGEWAVTRDSGGFVNRYTIETSGLRIINLNDPEYCELHWLAVLLENREFDSSSSVAYQEREYIRTTFSPGIQNCDCIIGYRADDCYFTFAQDFLNGSISYRQLKEALRTSRLGRQFVLKSNRAFDRVVYSGYETVRHTDVYPGRNAREIKALKDYYQNIADNRMMTDDFYIDQILSEEVKPYDPRLR